MTTVIVSGSRTWDRPDVVADELTSMAERALGQPERILVVRHGAAYPRPVRGVRPDVSADWLAHLWCESEAGHWDNLGLAVIEDPRPADWPHCGEECPPNHLKPNGYGQMYCPTAGHRRNTGMGEDGADELLAFWKGRSKGTKHMIDEAKRLGIPTKVIDYAAISVRGDSHVGN